MGVGAFRKTLTRMKKNILLFALIVLAVVPAAAQAPLSHFAWGVEAGGSIDMTSNDMSTLNIDSSFGYKNSWLDMAGVGAGIHVMVSNSCRSFPVYGVVRTSFRSKPSLCFMDLRAGVVFNDVNDDKTRSRLYVSPGIGFNLARSSKFRSYVALSYEYNGMKSYVRDEVKYDIKSLSMASVRLGISF